MSLLCKNFLMTFVKEFYSRFLDFKSIIALDKIIRDIEKVDLSDKTNSNDRFTLVDSFIVSKLVDNYEEQYGPVCGASSAASVVNYFTDSKLNTRDVLTTFMQHRAAIVEETFSFLNRNISKMKVMAQREKDFTEKKTVTKIDDEESKEDPNYTGVIKMEMESKSSSENKEDNPVENQITNENNEEEILLRNDSGSNKTDIESCNCIAKEDNESVNNKKLKILEYPELNTKLIFEELISIKTKQSEEKPKIDEFLECFIPEKGFVLKNPFKVKIRKAKANIKKMSKLLGVYNNCSTGPVGTEVWATCMHFLLSKHAPKTQQYKYVNLIGKKGYRVEALKSHVSNSIKRDQVWNEIKHYVSLIKKQHSSSSAILCFHLANHYAPIYGFREIELKDQQVNSEKRFRRQILCTRFGQRPKSWIDFDYSYYDNTLNKNKLCVFETICNYKGYNIVMLERTDLKKGAKTKIVQPTDIYALFQKGDKLKWCQSQYENLSSNIDIKNEIKNEQDEYKILERGIKKECSLELRQQDNLDDNDDDDNDNDDDRDV